MISDRNVNLSGEFTENASSYLRKKVFCISSFSIP